MEKDLKQIIIDGIKTKIIDLTGNIYGKLIVTNFAYRKRSGKNYKYYWACQCDCGGVCTVESNNLKSGITKSCGCCEKVFKKQILQEISKSEVNNAK